MSYPYLSLFLGTGDDDEVPESDFMKAFKVANFNIVEQPLQGTHLSETPCAQHAASVLQVDVRTKTRAIVMKQNVCDECCVGCAVHEALRWVVPGTYPRMS